jgi:hypothetical protein
MGWPSSGTQLEKLAVLDGLRGCEGFDTKGSPVTDLRSYTNAQSRSCSSELQAPILELQGQSFFKTKGILFASTRLS